MSSRWWAPGYSLALGAIVFAAFAIGGNAADGTKALALFRDRRRRCSGSAPHARTRRAASAAPAAMQRWAAIDLRASAFGGFVVILAAAGAWLYELAEGRDGDPYGQLLAVGGIAYVAAIAFLRRRS